MKIEKITLIEFDTERERKRIEDNFKGAMRTTLDNILLNFEQRNWDKACELASVIKDEEIEFLHPVVFKVLNDYQTQKALKAKTPVALEIRPEKHVQICDFAGIPMGPESLDYPKFRVLD